MNDDNGNFSVRVAVRRALAIRRGGTVADANLSLMTRIRYSIYGMLPVLFVCFFLVAFINGVFGVNGMYENSYWKTFVSTCGLVIKIVGNKIVLLLVAGVQPWMLDSQLFFFELPAALLLRLLTLSILDPDLAVMFALFGFVVEIITRCAFSWKKIKVFTSGEFAKMNDEEKIKFIISCKSKTTDSTNDMIVEYVSAISAGGMFLFFGRMTVLFIFAVGSVNRYHVFVMVAVQVLPEIIGDYIITYVENWFGFDKIFEK